MSERRNAPFPFSPYLEVDAPLKEPVLDDGQLVVAQVEDAESLEVLELAGAEHGVEGVAEEVVAEADYLERVADAVKEPIGQPSDLRGCSVVSRVSLQCGTLDSY